MSDHDYLGQVAQSAQSQRKRIAELERENAELRASLSAVQDHCVCGASDGTRKLEVGE